MDYEKTISFNGNLEKALETARNVFIQHSFQIVNDSSSAIELTGTGTMWLKGQDPLVGISRISIRGTGSEISVEAKFGGITKNIKYLIIFLLGMAVFFLVVFGVMLHLQQQDVRMVLLIALGPLVPWPIVIPLMAKFMKRRTSRALDALLHNMTVLGKKTL
ncbi:MAG: hypothetical protein ACYS1A_01925 [Planctomycetota bacterium]|jgi:hypothetical protein